MKMPGNRTNIILSWISLAAIILIGYNSIANVHTHQISKGWYITHAHPYHHIPIESNADDVGHKHSNKGYVYLHHIFDLLQILLIIALFRPLFLLLGFITTIRPTISIIPERILPREGDRGPPTCGN